jgi:hypothetical protein
MQCSKNYLHVIQHKISNVKQCLKYEIGKDISIQEYLYIYMFTHFINRAVISIQLFINKN